MKRGKKRWSAKELREKLESTHQALCDCLHLLHGYRTLEAEDGFPLSRKDAIEFAVDVAQMNERWVLRRPGRRQPTVEEACTIVTGRQYVVFDESEAGDGLSET